MARRPPHVSVEEWRIRERERQRVMREAHRAGFVPGPKPEFEPDDAPGRLVLVHVSRIGGRSCYAKVKEWEGHEGLWICKNHHVVTEQCVASVPTEPPDPHWERLCLPDTPYPTEAPVLAAPIVVEAL